MRSSKADHKATTETRHLPRILCLHGGGSNARIFTAQCRMLSLHLKPYFRLVFADAPFYSQAGPDVLSVYRDYTPFRRWFRWKPEHPELPAEDIVRAIEKSLELAMKEDDAKGATGEWVGVMGFSQGAKLAASLLLRQQAREERIGCHRTGIRFRFGVLLAGRGPLVSLDPQLLMNPSLVDAAHLGFQLQPHRQQAEHVLRIPTIHVHGRNDQGLPLHQHMKNHYCDKGSVRLIEWDGHHRVPLQTHVIEAIVGEILIVAQETGISIIRHEQPKTVA